MLTKEAPVALITWEITQVWGAETLQWDKDQTDLFYNKTHLANSKWQERKATSLPTGD